MGAVERVSHPGKLLADELSPGYGLASADLQISGRSWDSPRLGRRPSGRERVMLVTCPSFRCLLLSLIRRRMLIAPFSFVAF